MHDGPSIGLESKVNLVDISVQAAGSHRWIGIRLRTIEATLVGITTTRRWTIEDCPADVIRIMPRSILVRALCRIFFRAQDSTDLAPESAYTFRNC